MSQDRQQIEIAARMPPSLWRWCPLVPAVKTIRRFLFGALLSIPTLAVATEYQDSEQVAPESAQESSVGLERIEERLRLGPSRTVLRDLFKNAPPYWRDTTASVKLRTFDFRRDDGDERSRDALATGFELGIESGRWRERFSFSATWHTSYGLRDPAGLGNTGVLKPDQSDISVISRAFGQWNFSAITRVRFFRQDLNMPYINRQDSRMIPTTHEAYLLEHLGERFEGRIGYVARIKKQDSDEFIPMAEEAGVEGGNSGTSVINLQYSWPMGLKIGAVVQHSRDLFMTSYSETSFRKELSERWGLQIAAQLTRQTSTGAELLGNFDSYAWGLRGRISYRGAILTLAATEVGNAEIRSPFGGNPAYTVPMIGDFGRAHEETIRVGISQNLAPYGIRGVSATVNYTAGRNGRFENGLPAGDGDEIDVNIDLRPEKGIFKGVWFRIRWGQWNRGDGLPDRQDLRFIINYTLSTSG